MGWGDPPPASLLSNSSGQQQKINTKTLSFFVFLFLMASLPFFQSHHDLAHKHRIEHERAHSGNSMHSLRTEIDRTVDAKEELSLLRKYGTKVVKGSLRGFVEGRLDEVARRTERELSKTLGTGAENGGGDLASNLVRTSRSQAAMRNFGRVPFHESSTSSLGASGMKSSGQGTAKNKRNNKQSANAKRESLAEKLEQLERINQKAREKLESGSDASELFAEAAMTQESWADAMKMAKHSTGWKGGGKAFMERLQSQRDEYKEKASAVFMSDEDVAKADALIHQKQREEKENRKRRFFGGFRHNKRKDMDATLDEDTKTHFETILGGISGVQSDAESLLERTEDEKGSLVSHAREKQETYLKRHNSKSRDIPSWLQARLESNTYSATESDPLEIEPNNLARWIPAITAREHVLPKRSRNGLECSSSPVTADLRDSGRLMQRDLKYLQRVWSSLDATRLAQGLWARMPLLSEGSNVIFRDRVASSSSTSSRESRSDASATPRVHKPRVHKEHRPAEMSTDTNEAIEQLRAAIAKGKAFKDDDDDEEEDDDDEEEEEEEQMEQKPQTAENAEQQSAEVLNTVAQALNLDSTDIEELGLVSIKNRDKEGREVVLDAAMLEKPIGEDGENGAEEDGIEEGGDENANNKDEDTEQEQQPQQQQGKDGNDDNYSNDASVVVSGDDNTDDVGEEVPERRRRRRRLLSTSQKPRSIPLTLHRAMLFPDDYHTSDKYCPAGMKGCTESERRLPRAIELKQETFVDGVTQRGGADGDLLQVKQGERQRLKLKLDLVGVLPLNDEDYEFKTCAVVGNSGVLLKSKQGKEIDEHEKVFRINYAPTAGYEEDVGSRTDFDFVNLQHVKPFIAGRTRLGGSIPESSRSALRNTTLVLFEIFNPFARYHYYAPLLKRLETARVSGVANEHVAPGSSAIVVSPEIIAHAFKLWEAVKKAVELGAVFAGFHSKRFKPKPMSGVFAATFALHSCEKVSLYGFSPYSKTSAISSDSNKYHYFDSITGTTTHHSFDLAYEFYRQLSLWPCGGIALDIKT